MSEFTEDRIDYLTKRHNWMLIKSERNEGLYFLRQKDKSYMRTVDFELPESVANKYLIAP